MSGTEVWSSKALWINISFQQINVDISLVAIANTSASNTLFLAMRFSFCSVLHIKICKSSSSSSSSSSSCCCCFCYFIFCELFTPVLSGGLSLEWLQDSSGFQISSQLSDRFQQCCSQDNIDSAKDFQPFQSSFQGFGGHYKRTNNS